MTAWLRDWFVDPDATQLAMLALGVFMVVALAAIWVYDRRTFRRDFQSWDERHRAIRKKDKDA